MRVSTAMERQQPSIDWTIPAFWIMGVVGCLAAWAVFLHLVAGPLLRMAGVL